MIIYQQQNYLTRTFEVRDEGNQIFSIEIGDEMLLAGLKQI